MATNKTEAQKVADLRKQAMDKSLPQEVRDMADKKANQIEGRSVEKATGMKLAKGGAVMAGGGFSGPRGGVTGGPLMKPPPKPKQVTVKPSDVAAIKSKLTPMNMKMAKGGAVRKYGMGGFNPPVDKNKPLPFVDMMAPKVDKTKPAPKPIAQKQQPVTRKLLKAMSKPIDTKSAKPLNPTMMAKGGSVKKAKK